MKQLEDVLQSLAGGGWAELDGIGSSFAKNAREQGQQERDEMNRQAGIVGRALGTADGRAMLDLMLRMTLLRQPGDAERATTAEASAIAAAERRGQNAIVFMLLSRLQQFHAEKPLQTGGDL